MKTVFFMSIISFSTFAFAAKSNVTCHVTEADGKNLFQQYDIQGTDQNDNSFQIYVEGTSKYLKDYYFRAVLTRFDNTVAAVAKKNGVESSASAKGSVLLSLNTDSLEELMLDCKVK